MNKKIIIAGKEFKLIHIALSLLMVAMFAVFFVWMMVSSNSVSLSPNGKNVTANDLVSQPKKFKNYSIDFIGKVFVAEGGVGEQALQVYSDVKSSDGNIIVYNYTSTEYSEGEFIRVKGVVSDANEGENAFGAKLTAAVVIADSIEIVMPDEALAPKIKAVELNQSQQIGALTVTLNRVEYAKDETRLYFRFDNKTSDDYSFYTFDSTLVQNRKKLSEKSVYDRNEEMIESTISAGTVQEIKLYYDALKEDEEATFTAEVTNQNSYDSTNLSFIIK